jgi:hypothetical protein
VKLRTQEAIHGEGRGLGTHGEAIADPGHHDLRPIELGALSEKMSVSPASLPHANMQ